MHMPFGDYAKWRASGQGLDRPPILPQPAAPSAETAAAKGIPQAAVAKAASSGTSKAEIAGAEEQAKLLAGADETAKLEQDPPPDKEPPSKRKGKHEQDPPPNKRKRSAEQDPPPNKQKGKHEKDPTTDGQNPHEMWT